MIITCEQCNASFKLDERRLSKNGSKVRCSKCKHIFMAYPPSDVGTGEPVAPAPVKPAVSEPQSDDGMAAASAASAPGAEDIAGAPAADTDSNLETPAVQDNLDFRIDDKPVSETVNDSGLDDLFAPETQPAETGSTEPLPGTVFDEDDLETPDMDLNLDLDPDLTDDSDDLEKDISLFLDNEPEPTDAKPGPSEAVDVLTTPAADTDDLDLSDLDLDSESDYDLSTLASTDEKIDDFDFSDLDLGTEAEADPADLEAASDEAALDDFDLSDLDFESESVADAAPVDVSSDDSDDFDLSDLDFESESVADAAPVDVSSDDSDDFDLSDLDLEPESAADTASADSPLDDSDDLDLSDLDALLDFDEPETEMAGTDADDLNLDLDLDLEAAAAPESVGEALFESSESDDLDLSDLDFDLESETADPETNAGTGGEADFNLDLDLDLDLDLEPDSEPMAAAAGDADVKTDADELDLSDMMPAQDAAGESENAFEDLGFDFDLEPDSASANEPTASDDQPAASDELDFSDIMPAQDAAGESENAFNDLGFDVDLESGSAPAGQPVAAEELDLPDIKPAQEAAGEPENAFEDLDLDLDLDFEPGDAPSAGQPAESEDLDLSDLESILGDGTAASAGGAGGGEEDLDIADIEFLINSEQIPPGAVGKPEDGFEELDLELDADIDEADDLDGSSLAAYDTGAEMPDLSNLDGILDAGNVPKPGVETTDDFEDLDLDLEFDKQAEDDGQFGGKGEITEEDLDFSVMDKMFQEDKPGLGDSADDLEFNLELDIDEESREKQELGASDLFEDDLELELDKPEDDREYDLDIATTDNPSVLDDSETVARERVEALDAPTADRAETGGPGAFPIDSDTDESDLDEPVAPARASKSRAPVMVLLIIVVLIAGAFCSVFVLDRMGKEIPVLTDLVRKTPVAGDMLLPAPQEPGNMMISTDEVASRFERNVKAGQLFVITGKVKNDYSTNRSHIKVIGKIYAKGKKLTKTETVYCGNTLSSIDLSQMDPAEISKRLQNRMGDSRSNVNIKPGKAIPFMIVFSDVPEDLEEYTIEVDSSTLN